MRNKSKHNEYTTSKFASFNALKHHEKIKNFPFPCLPKILKPITSKFTSKSSVESGNKK